MSNLEIIKIVKEEIEKLLKSEGKDMTIIDLSDNSLMFGYLDHNGQLKTKQIFVRSFD